MYLTIISNNCSAAALYQDENMVYGSPTIILQILPQEYTKFCKNLEHYMNCDVKPYTEFSDIHRQYCEEFYGQLPYFPCGIIDDVMILFQHYKTFDEARQKWNLRKSRVNYDNIGFVFILEKPYLKEAVEFGNAGLPNSVLFTRNFDVDVPCEHYRYDLEPDIEFMGRDKRTGYRNFEQNFDHKAWFKRFKK